MRRAGWREVLAALIVVALTAVVLVVLWFIAPGLTALLVFTFVFMAALAGAAHALAWAVEVLSMYFQGKRP